MPLCLLQILTSDIDRSKHDILYNSLVVIQIEMLENHTHMTAVYVDINLRVCYINTIEYNLTAGRIFHTIQTAKKCTFTRT